MMLKFLMCAASIFYKATDQSRPIPAGKEILHLSRSNAYRCSPEWRALGRTRIARFRPKKRKIATTAALPGLMLILPRRGSRQRGDGARRASVGCATEI